MYNTNIYELEKLVQSIIPVWLKAKRFTRDFKTGSEISDT